MSSWARISDLSGERLTSRTASVTSSIGYHRFPFIRVNPIQTRKLYELALEYAGLTGNETVWDLYCGIGTISCFWPGNAAAYAVLEIIPQAIEDAKTKRRVKWH